MISGSPISRTPISATTPGRGTSLANGPGGTIFSGPVR